MQSFFSACPMCGSADSREHVSFPQLRFVTCSACGLLYKSHEVPGLAASLSKGYDGGYFEKGRAQYLKRWNHRVAKCRRQLLMCLEFAPHAKSVLDVGSSAGYVLAAGQSLGLQSTGIDYASWAAKLGHERGFPTAAASLTHLPFRDASFDIVTAKHTLEHVPTPKLGLSEIARTLKPGGVAFIVVPDAKHWQLHLRKKTGGYFKPQRLGWQHHVYYDVKTLRTGLEGAGLSVVSDDKAMLRRRLAKGIAAPWEFARVAGLKVWTTFSKLTHLRREIQLIAVKR
ncbi:MAG: class I SAM-dependent methyltransferase [Archangium sp.]